MLERRTNGRALVTVAIVLVVLAVAVVFVSRELRETARVKPVNRDTAVDAVTGPVTISAEGGFKEVRSEAAGKVLNAQSINKDSRFTKGAPLVQLDPTDLDRQIAELERVFLATQERFKIQLKDNPTEKVAEETLATATRLREVGRSTDEQVKTAQRALDAVRRQLALDEFDRQKAVADHNAKMSELRILREKMTIPAPPIDGAVQVPLTWEGALIGASQAVAVVYSNTRVVAAKISEEDFGKVKIGQSALLRLLTYGEKTFNAKVSKLLPTADDAQRFEVWLDVEVDPAMLLPNSTGEVTITVDAHPDALVIPRRALFSGDSVWVVKNGRVERRRVTIGYDSALNVVEILKGLDAGEHIIVDRLDEFHQGQRVRTVVVN
jgi:RND family efflux transporter MFP subunit